MRERLAIYKRLYGYLSPYKRQLLLAYGGMLAAVLLNLFIPQIIKTAIDNAIDIGAVDAILQSAGLILLVAAVRAGASFCQRYYGEWLTYRVSFDLRNDFYNAVQYLPFSFHDKAHTGDLMSRATSDVSETERFVGTGSVDLVSTVMLLVGVITAMFLENSRLALMALGPMIILVFVALRFGAKVRSLFKALQEQMAVISKTMQESLTGIQLVKVFSRQAHELERFDVENDEWHDRRVTLIHTWSNNWPFMTFLVSVSILLLLWFGGEMALENQITVGSLFALISYMLLLNGPVQRVGFLVNLAATAVSASGRVFEIMDEPNEVEDRSDAHKLPNVNGRVTFEHVDFGYGDGKDILHDLTFEAEAGQTIALIGPTGSGKSTVTNLIPRFYDVRNGRISVDDHDIRDLTLYSLRKEIGMVLQDSFLYSNTLADNIAYGRPDASREDIIEAAKAARAHKFITTFPQGYDTMIGERGVTLSGGQRQRIAIARALLADPSILILDDSTSSVDTETEYLIQEALKVLMEGRTTFVIAQRLLTLKSADQILVLDDGRIVERGTHDELLQMNGLYKHLYDLQLKDQEEMQAALA